ncbi:MAG: hypothetical protein M0Q52_11435, partial [Lascolabacillus sp.]|nr:hypothetical protein [Lascolabacillus sp.]
WWERRKRRRVDFFEKRHASEKEELQLPLFCPTRLVLKEGWIPPGAKKGSQLPEAVAAADDGKIDAKHLASSAEAIFSAPTLLPRKKTACQFFDRPLDDVDQFLNRFSLIGH